MRRAVELDEVEELAVVLAAAASTPLTLFDGDAVEEVGRRRVECDDEEEVARDEETDTASTPETLNAIIIRGEWKGNMW